ncbi:predicted protein [Coccidioides posadasii str. Silveira]|uniref:Predicted protein n=2 Tax=Coccidioides posadasii TaxID=199306 RepID=E9CVN4_COCPS|nr:predicted protein [Coccidioides posadasii str. Silveira]KMM64828.1 hypothetical protein CPAG_01180 [Coccidioides posadasii RMSCC 3488]
MSDAKGKTSCNTQLKGMLDIGSTSNPYQDEFAFRIPKPIIVDASSYHSQCDSGWHGRVIFWHGTIFQEILGTQPQGNCQFITKNRHYRVTGVGGEEVKEGLGVVIAKSS